jgi:hypothetical protein
MSWVAGVSLRLVACYDMHLFVEVAGKARKGGVH